MFCCTNSIFVEILTSKNMSEHYNKCWYCRSCIGNLKFITALLLVRRAIKFQKHSSFWRRTVDTVTLTSTNLSFLNRALWYSYVIRINKVNSLCIKVVIELQCLRNVSNIQVFTLRKSFIHAVLQYFFMHLYKQSGRWQDVLDIKYILLIWMHKEIP